MEWYIWLAVCFAGPFVVWVVGLVASFIAHALSKSLDSSAPTVIIFVTWVVATLVAVVSGVMAIITGGQALMEVLS